ncbi:MAG: CRTAC1 family protein, partial [Planctomycetia bacterium]|nr:CRTAC1 family protein [Planctomycetia bacterium]
SRLGFGAVFLDYDRDGVQDLAVANGHVHRDAADLHGVPYAQAAQLFQGEGDGRFRVADLDAGTDFLRQRVGRGLARGDYDNDGRPDLALSGVGEPLALLRNQLENANDWIGLDLRGDGRASNRSAIGAVVTITAGGRTQTHFVTGGGSYLSASDRRLTIGLGNLPDATASVRVRWPSGQVQEFPSLGTGRYWTLDEGQPAAKPKTAS